MAAGKPSGHSWPPVTSFKSEMFSSLTELFRTLNITFKLLLTMILTYVTLFPFQISLYIWILYFFWVLFLSILFLIWQCQIYVFTFPAPLHRLGYQYLNISKIPNTRFVPTNNIFLLLKHSYQFFLYFHNFIFQQFYIQHIMYSLISILFPLLHSLILLTNFISKFWNHCSFTSSVLSMYAYKFIF